MYSHAYAQTYGLADINQWVQFQLEFRARIDFVYLWWSLSIACVVRCNVCIGLNFSPHRMRTHFIFVTVIVICKFSWLLKKAACIQRKWNNSNDIWDLMDFFFYCEKRKSKCHNVFHFLKNKVDVKSSECSICESISSRANAIIQRKSVNQFRYLISYCVAVILSFLIALCFTCKWNFEHEWT